MEDSSNRTALVPYDSHAMSLAVVQPVEQKLERLRSEREAHSRKQVWTKDAHGGPYRKVNAHQGYDPLIQLPDGSERPMDLGYERCPKLGPTTNFVGNHMTQGAIDLVQAQLEGAGVEGAAAAVEQGAGIGSSPSRSSALPTSVASLPPLLYRWRDEGSTVRIEVPLGRVLQRLGTSTAEGAPHLRCCFKADSLEVSMMALAEAADVALAVVELAKLDCQRHWAAVLASGGSSGSGSSCIEIATTPDLTTLRRAVRQQLQRGNVAS